MTATNTNAITCPNCHDTAHVGLSDGYVLCLNCRTEWNPATDRALQSVPTPGETEPDDVAVGGGPAHPADTPATTSEPAGDAASSSAGETSPDDGWAILHELVGTQVILEGGQVAEVVDFPDDDHVEVLVGIGGANLRTEIVPFNVVERSVSTPPPVVDVDDDTARALAGVNLAVAGLAIRAALASIAGEYPNAQIITPPSGWLPLDADGLPALEQGVAYAIAAVVHGWQLDRERVAAIADTFIEASAITTETKGGTEGDTDSGNDDDAGTATGGRNAETDVHGVGRPTDT